MPVELPIGNVQLTRQKHQAKQGSSNTHCRDVVTQLFCGPFIHVDCIEVFQLIYPLQCESVREIVELVNENKRTEDSIIVNKAAASKVRFQSCR